MKIVNEKDFPKEIIINLKRYEIDKEFNTKCFVAHDYVGIETGVFIEDKNEKGYWIKQYIQIPINVMAQLLKKLNSSPFLTDKNHYNRYLHKDEIVQFQEWHLPINKKGRREILFRGEGSDKWISVPEKRWSSEKLSILKNLE